MVIDLAQYRKEKLLSGELTTTNKVYQENAEVIDLWDATMARLDRAGAEVYVWHSVLD